MNRAFFASLLMGGLMLLSALAAYKFTPTIFLWKSLPPMDLQGSVPRQFGDWQEDRNQAGAVINPESLELVNKLYAQTLERVYVNGQGQRIMLSIAYGTDQRDALGVHHPEVCYPAQGFQVRSLVKGSLPTPAGAIAVLRLETNMGSQRYEPVTYWTTIGDQVIEGALNKKLTELRYSFKGQIPDGLLFRVSSIDTNSEAAFALQQRFVAAMVAVLPAAQQSRLAGLH